MPRLDTHGYLERLGIADPGEPSIAGLRALHAAHVERVAYEAIEIQLGRPTTVDPHESAERIVERHRGGYSNATAAATATTSTAPSRCCCVSSVTTSCGIAPASRTVRIQTIPAPTGRTT